MFYLWFVKTYFISQSMLMNESKIPIQLTKYKCMVWHPSNKNTRLEHPLHRISFASLNCWWLCLLVCFICNIESAKYVQYLKINQKVLSKLLTHPPFWREAVCMPWIFCLVFLTHKVEISVDPSLIVVYNVSFKRF